MPRFRSTHYRKTPTESPRPEEGWGQLSVAQAIYRCLEESPHLAAATAKNWRSIANKASIIIGRKTLDTLNTNDLGAYQRTRLAHGAAKSSVRQEMSVITTAVHRTRPDLRVHVVQRDRGKEREGIALSEEQTTRLLEASQPHHELQLAIHLGLHGLRIGEILQLRRQDWQSPRLLIQKSKTPAGTRRIPLNSTAAVAINAQLARDTARQPHQHLFPGTRDPQKGRSDFDRAWTNARRAAHLEHIRFHDLRHTCITRLCEAGVPDWTIRAYVGHVSEDMMRIYSHPRGEALKQAAAALELEPEAK